MLLDHAGQIHAAAGQADIQQYHIRYLADGRVDQFGFGAGLGADHDVSRLAEEEMYPFAEERLLIRDDNLYFSFRCGHYFSRRSTLTVIIQ